MPRQMSFFLTTEQVRKRIKTVTRRLGWSFLKPGDILTAVKKGMGLKKGEKVEKLATIKIKSVKTESLILITSDDVIKEGFPGKTIGWFIDMFCRTHNCSSFRIVRRIEFEYLD